MEKIYWRLPFTLLDVYKGNPFVFLPRQSLSSASARVVAPAPADWLQATTDKIYQASTNGAWTLSDLAW